MSDEEMSPEEARSHLDRIGAAIRLSELPDDVVVTQVVIDVLAGLFRNGIEVDSGQMGEILSTALVKLGGFHRAGSCQW
jgi:hypothetical protein